LLNNSLKSNNNFSKDRCQAIVSTIAAIDLADMDRFSLVATWYNKL